ncbi:metal ABC transporter permease [Solibaculum mannosilyticum]|uniref:metal ABC transporter permease n=1 Tax=Solibaculum mannosilyticum TaxID=2780922 RepID=UPI0034BEAE5F
MMDVIYQVMESILPFSWIQYDFMKNALLAVLLITPLFGMIGTMVVDHKLAFFSDALGHSALTGIAIGVLLGVAEPMVAMTIFAVIFAILLAQIKRSKVSSSDTIISVFSSTAIALGLVLLSAGGKFSQYSNYLIGDILTIRPQELLILVAVLVAGIVFWLLFFNKLLILSVNSVLAKSRGIRVRLVETAFITLIAILVTVSIKWVGILIINSLLILPAAASRNISHNVRQYNGVAVLFSMVSGVAGLIISYYAGTAAGPTIVLVGAAIFFLTFAFKQSVRKS